MIADLNDYPVPVTFDAAAAFLSMHLGHDWKNMSAAEIDAALRETDWYKTMVQIREDWDREGQEMLDELRKLANPDG